MNSRNITLVLAIVFCISGKVAFGQEPTELPNPTPPNPVTDLSTAAQLYRFGKIDAAEKAYQMLIGSAPSAEAYAGLAQVYLRKRNPEGAYAAATKAIEIGPKSSAAHVAIGAAYFRQGKIDQAQKEFATVIDSGAGEPRAYLGMARVYWAASFYTEAKRMIDRAREMDPNDPDIRRFWLNTLNLQDRIQAAEDYLSQASPDDQTRAFFQHDLGIWKARAALPIGNCRLVAPVNSMHGNLKELMKDARHLRGFGLGVNLNGVRLTLMLDTGSSGITIDRKVAEKVGIKQLFPIKLGGIGDSGAATGYRGIADSILIGDLEFRSCYVNVIESNSVVDDDGLIGGNVFGRYLVDFDFPNRKFSLSELPSRPQDSPGASSLESNLEDAPNLYDRYVAPDMRTFSQVFRFGYFLLVPTKINDSAPKLFAVDTGTFRTTISPEAAREVTNVHEDPSMRVKGFNGDVKTVLSGDKLTLEFGGLKQPNQNIVTFSHASFGDSLGREVSGIVGLDTLQLLDVQIDYRDSLVQFRYKGGR